MRSEKQMTNIKAIELLNQQAAQIAFDLVRLSHHSKTPHLGSNMSPVTLLTALYFDVMTIEPAQAELPNRDRFYMSKGHASALHYMTLAHRGFFDVDEVFQLAKQGSIFEEHSGIHAPKGVETVNGSLGHALGLSAGAALSARLLKQNHHHFVLMGDGEINEGSIWEAAMFIPANGLANVTAIIDHNKWQATGRSQEVFGLTQIANQFKSFGWHVFDIDGHDMNDVVNTLNACKAHSNTHGKPCAIIANTVKGKGVSFMEDDNNWHYRIPNDEELVLAKQELLGNA